MPVFRREKTPLYSVLCKQREIHAGAHIIGHIKLNDISHDKIGNSELYT